MPSAPNSRAFAASSGVSAFARTRSRRSSSAQSRIVPKFSSIAGGTSRTGPTMTRPVPPSIVITSPTFSVCSPIVTVSALASIERLSHPATHGFPIPRATTAACDVMPPWAVRTPRAWMSPWMSSGVVSQRTRITSSPALPRSSAVSASSTISPEAAPGEAFSPWAATSTGDGRVDHRVQELVELARVDPRDRLLAGDQPRVGHLDGDAEGRRRRALAGAGLQEVQPALLDGELDVLHVAVVGLEPVERGRQLRVGLRQPLAHRRDRLGRPDPRDDVLSLRVDEELAVQDRLARRRIAGEAHARPRALALVAEHHLHDVHRRPDVVRNLVRAPIHLGPRRVPRVEDGPVGAAQLLPWILREAGADLLLVDLLEGRDQLPEVVGVELEIVRHPAGCLEIGDRALEPMPVDAVHDLAVHLDQAPVRVVGEPRDSPSPPPGPRRRRRSGRG